jgi:hypothetical protein
MIYKVSYVEENGQYPGGIRNEGRRPEIGDFVQIGPRRFKVILVHEILPPRGDFHYIQATVQYLSEVAAAVSGK